MPQNLYIVRGLPGSGKSTFANALIRSGAVDKHYEADMYFLDEFNGYKFDPKKLGYAHDWCFEKTRAAIGRRESVVVTNTFTRKWEYTNYAAIPSLFPTQNIVVHVLTMNGNYKNIHKVPDAAIDKMRLRWEY